MQEMRTIPDYPNYSITPDGKVWSHTSNRFLKIGQHQGQQVVRLTYAPKKSTMKTIPFLLSATYNERPENLRPIPEYPGYAITKDGKVYSCKQRKEGRFIKGWMHYHGYHHVMLMNVDNKRVDNAVHRLVALTYIPNPENKPCVDHINRKRFDNRVENLRWVSVQENCNNMVVGRGHIHFCKGEKSSKTKPWRCQWSTYSQPMGKQFKTKQEAEAYQKIVYQLRCAIRRMRGLSY